MQGNHNHYDRVAEIYASFNFLSIREIAKITA